MTIKYFAKNYEKHKSNENLTHFFSQLEYETGGTLFNAWQANCTHALYGMKVLENIKAHYSCSK
jgi:hypothetical protein